MVPTDHEPVSNPPNCHEPVSDPPTGHEPASNPPTCHEPVSNPAPPERERLTNSLRRWQTGGAYAPCTPSSNESALEHPDGRVDLALLLADRPGGAADAWATRHSDLLGEARECFGSVTLRHARLSKKQQHYIGGWDNTGPNALHANIFQDERIHAGESTHFSPCVLPHVIKWRMFPPCVS